MGAVALEQSQPGSVPVVLAYQVSRRYPANLVLRPLSFRVDAGERVALLGPNGAGKSTLLRMLATLLSPTAGSLRLFGLDPVRDGQAIREKVGFLGHHSMLYGELTAAENLHYYASLYGCADAAERVATALQSVGLSQRANDQVRTFSRGMQQRLSLARALLHRPELLLLDEPEAGLDAQAQEFWPALLVEGAQAPATVVFTSHQIERALGLARRAIVLVRGRAVYDGPTAGITASQVSQLYSASMGKTRGA